MDRYQVFKHTGTHADVLCAVGAADVLRHLEPRIVEFEDRFEIQLPRNLRPADLEAVEPGFSYLLRPKQASPNLPPERICATPAENRMYAILGRLKAYGGPNQLVSSFARMRRQEWESRIWKCFLGDTKFVPASALVQLFNPQAAKGYSLLKPSGTNRNDKTKNRWAEPFPEWLRYRGYFEGCAGWFAGGDLLLFCPIPADISHRQLISTVAAFRDLRMGGTGVKMECRAVLALARLSIETSHEYRRPCEVMRGVWVTHYKDMGQAHTLMGMEQLALPDWFDLRNPQEAELWLRTLEEHDTILRRLTDSHSEEFAALKQYRNIFTFQRRESAHQFLDFLAAYGPLVFKRRAEDYWLLPQFNMTGVTSILECDADLRDLLHNPGFAAVSAALRSATMGAQVARKNIRPGRREVRYGVFSSIRRAGMLGARHLVELISSFVSGFNAESTVRRAAGTPSATIGNSELQQFACVLDRVQAYTMATALCGLGACIRAEQTVAQSEKELARALSA